MRVDRPNAAWQIDCTIVKLLDGSKAYVQSVMDNFSLRPLAWTVDDKLNPGNTCHILFAAAEHLGATVTETEVFMDGGGENVRNEVDGLSDVKPLHRILAQVDVSYSNSLIEACWNYSSDCVLAVSDGSKSVGSSSRIRIRKPFARPWRI